MINREGIKLLNVSIAMSEVVNINRRVGIVAKRRECGGPGPGGWMLRGGELCVRVVEK